MGMGIAFTFIGLAVLAVPIVWLAWWAADSLGSRPARLAVAVPSAPRAPRAQFRHPEPVDLRLPSRPDLITVYRAVNTRPEYVCHGPDADGHCPISHSDGTVACAGRTIVLPAAVRGSRDWQIPEGYTSCLVGSYTAFRQHPTA